MMKKHKLQAVIFDLDGVITKTATVHSHAWKKMFDDYLRERAEKKGEPFKEFTQEDYLAFVDGKPRYDGVKSFLESRNIDLPFGTPEDTTDKETVCGLGNRKNESFNEVLRNDGVEVYPSTVKLMEQLHKENIRVGVASSSKNCEAVLEAAGLSHLVETRVDGVVSAEIGLNGKPAPDIFLTAAKNLHCDYNYSVVVEDAVSGVAAGRNGNFGLVLGVAREDNKAGLWANGADWVVEDLSEITLEDIYRWFDVEMEQNSNRLVYHDYDVAKERSREALLTVGNGFFGTRGAMEETSSNKINYPGTYVAGLYNRLTTPVAGREVENEDFVNVPNWLPVSFKIEDEPWFNPNEAKIVEIRRTLDFKTGLLMRMMIVEDEEGRRTKIESCRFASMDNMHLAALRYKITPLNYSATISIYSSLDGTVKNEGVERYKSLKSKHLVPVAQGGEGAVSWLEVKTNQSGITIAEAAKLSLKNGNSNLEAFGVSSDDGIVYTYMDVDAREGKTIILEKLVALATSLETNGDVRTFVLEQIEPATNFDELFHKSSAAWGALWDEADIHLTGDRASQRLLRMHIYHLLVSASPHNAKLDASITARGLHGEAYRGHIFWDELFVLPFYDIHFPDIAKALLMYRYNRLEKAREYARQHGYKGAMYPWQSGSDGREETQVVHLNPVSGKWGDDYSSLQRHVSLAVAYNVYQYFHITNDHGFINQYGAEMFFEIARFWADMAQFDEKTGRYSVEGVMGPDEFHEKYPGADKGGLKDNAYTNVMIAWLFKKSQELVETMETESKNALFNAIGISDAEIAGWQEIRKKLNLIINEEGIISQYDGYFDLQELDWDYYRKKYGNIHRMDRLLKAEGKSADDYKVAKQADTLMIFYVLNKDTVDELFADMGYHLPDDYLEKNLRYYLARTSHGSTLSRVVHAQLANMIGDDRLSWELYYDALESDFNDIQGGTTGEGIHAGVMAGTLMIALTNFAGIDIRGNKLTIDPKMPERWKTLFSKLHFKQIWWNVEVSNEKVILSADKEAKVNVNGTGIDVKADEKVITLS